MKKTITATEIVNAVIADRNCDDIDFAHTVGPNGMTPTRVWLTNYVWGHFRKAVPQSTIATAVSTLRALRFTEPK